MNSTAHPVSVPDQPAGALAPTLAVLPVALVLTLLLGISSGVLNVLSPAQYLVPALLAFSPLPFSLPAVALEAHRDAALPGLSGQWLRRSLALIPHLLLSPASSCRREMAASLAGFAAACLLALPVLVRG